MQLAEVSSQLNGLGAHPQMGWNSWNKFHCDVSAELLKNATTSMESLGLNDFGY